MKIYTIIGGVNGVGKSSLTGVLASESNDLGVIIDTDKITASLGGDSKKKVDMIFPNKMLNADTINALKI